MAGSFYKIVSKLLTERLKNVMHKVERKFPEGFHQRIQIMDVVLIADECLDSKIESSTTGVLCKLNIENAFNHMNWIELPGTCC